MQSLPTRRMLACIALGASIAGGFWAGRFFSKDASITQQPSTPLTVVSRQGTLQEQYNISFDISWDQSAGLAYLGSEGVVTSSQLAGPESYVSVDSGDELMTIDLKPVMAMDGEVPAFRAIGSETRGEDVVQLQQGLEKLGYLTGGYTVGEFDDATSVATSALFTERRIPYDGSVPLGSVVFIPSLPQWVRASDSVVVGSVVNFGQPLLTVASPTPLASVRLSALQTQRSLFGTPTFEITTSEGSFEVFANGGLGAVQPGVGPDPASLSISLPPNALNLTPSVTPMVLPGTMTVVPSTSGTVLPLIALRNIEESNAEVAVVGGTILQVKILAIVGGEAVVTGIDPESVVVVSAK